MAEQTVEIRGTSIAYTDEGDGPVVVVLHGLTGSREQMIAGGRFDRGAFRRAGFRHIAYDARGHGASAGTPEPGAYRWNELALDLLAFLDAVVPDEPVRAFGISMGTATTLTALTLAPERFAAVTLGAPPTAWATRAAQAGQYRALAAMAESVSDAAFRATLDEAPPAPIFAVEPRPAVVGTPEYRLLPAIYRGAGASDLPEPAALSGIAVPALILSWATDPAHPVATGETLAESLPDSLLRISKTLDDVRDWAPRAARFFAAVDAE